MKKISLLLFSLLFTMFSYAQLSVGPQIGYTASNLSMNRDSITNSMKHNLLVGGFVRLGTKVYIQPELNYLTQGSVVKWPSLGNLSPLQQEITIKTLQVPVNLGYKVINAGIVSVRLFGGAVMNYNLNTQIENTNDSEEYQKLVPEDFRNLTWQWDLGAGVDVLMFTLDVKYVGGITNVLNDIQINGTEITSKSNLFVVTLGWKIL